MTSVIICKYRVEGKVDDDGCIDLLQIVKEKRELMDQYLSGSKSLDHLSFENVPWVKLLSTHNEDCDIPINDDCASTTWAHNNSTKEICDELCVI